MQILRAAEDYLEAMLMMQQKHGYIRSIDIAEQLGVTKPSVTYTTKRLRENGYITMDRDGLITLTPSGMDIAARMLDRHHTLTKFLMELGVDAKTAEEDDPARFDYFVAIITSAMIGVLTVWVEHGKTETEDQMVQKLTSAFIEMAILELPG